MSSGISGTGLIASSEVLVRVEPGVLGGTGEKLVGVRGESIGDVDCADIGLDIGGVKLSTIGMNAGRIDCSSTDVCLTRTCSVLRTLFSDPMSTM